MGKEINTAFVKGGNSEENLNVLYIIKLWNEDFSKKEE